MHLFFEGKDIFRVTGEKLIVGDQIFPFINCRHDWLIAFSGRLLKLPKNHVIIDPLWLEPLKYNLSAKRLFDQYNLPYIGIANQLGISNTIINPNRENETISLTVEQIKKNSNLIKCI